MLSVQSVSKTYPNQLKPAVENVSFSLQKGEILAIVGESGSGKTTLLKMINGLEDCDEGYVYLNNKQVLGSAYTLVAGHKRIKLLRQDFNLMPRHKVYENIAYYLRLYSQEEQNFRVQQLLEWCNLQELANKYPSELSGGQQQRVALAVALADEPDLLLLDEPFSHLDRRLKVRLRQETKDILQKSGMASILVTHDIEDAFYLADKIAIMQSGKIIQNDSPQNIFENPLNPYIAELLGYTNILCYKDLKNIITNYQVNLSEKLILIKDKNIGIELDKIPNASVKQVVFLGNYYEITIKVGKVLLNFRTTIKLLVNQKMTVYIPENSIYYF
jgi:iron(III) transport system ATP-binding protein